MLTAFYNDLEHYVCDWLLNLQREGDLPGGSVNYQPIQQLKGADLKGYDQCHFFAGIGGWPYALRLAGWPTTRPVWTGSCPCQPFSAAGKQQGFKDDRDLWPDWFRLIRECRPATIFGEQVASAIGFGWLDRVCLDLEGEGYAVGATVLPACSVGAPHIRSRLFWVADATDSRRNDAREHRSGPSPLSARSEQCGIDGGMAFAASEQVGRAGQSRQRAAQGLGEPIQQGLQGHARNGDDCDESRRDDSHQTGSAWAASDLTYCLDGKTRRIGSGIQPLAHGVPARVGKLRAAGNAIVPQVAAEFIKAFMDTEG